MKTLDIVRTKLGGLGIVTETNRNGQEASIDFFKTLNPHNEKNAWWGIEEVEVIDNLPRVLARAMCHPFGSGQDDVSKFFT